jgi:hypothetical protein
MHQMDQTAVSGVNKFLTKLKVKWGLDSLVQVVLVLVVFSLTGMSVVFLRKTFFHLIGFDEHTPMWLKTVTYIFTVFPAYQVLLLFYGFLLGQFSFFWEKEKKMFRFIAKAFRRS